MLISWWGLLFFISGVISQDLTGSWTGFEGQVEQPLFDWYTFNYDNLTGLFTVECSSGYCGWTNGTGKVAGDNVKLGFNNGVTLSGNITYNTSQCGWTDAPSSSCPLPPPFEASCMVIFWDNNSSWIMLQPIDKVHLIFMNHLDVGYNGIPLTGFINNILNIYFHEYFPRAISVANTLKVLNLTQGLIYTTHPWLVSLYLDCPPNLILSGIPLKCPSYEEVESMEAAIRQGVITWHRGPFNLQPENMDASLFDFALSIAEDLDYQFDLPYKMTLSQRDVPGMTRGVIPHLVGNGVKAVSVGVNGGSCPPAVPRAFVWKDEGSGLDILAMWHSGGYPGNPGSSAQQPGGLSRGDCVTVRGFREALCWAFRTDNSGPPEDINEVLNNFDVVSAQFPGAQVVASTFDAFTQQLLTFKSNLPIFTEEIGDVWIQGIASDPFKMAQFRTIARARSACIEAGDCYLEDPILKNMSRWLIKPPEHTWGLPSVGDGQFSLWSNEQFEQSRKQQIYLNCEAAWVEQREFNQLALDTLIEANHPLAKILIDELAALEPSIPSTTGFSQAPNISQIFTCQGIKIGFDSTGAITMLTDQNGNEWASPSSPLSKLVYTTWNESGYNPNLPCNNVLGGKPGSNEAGPKNQDWFTSLISLWEYEDSCTFLAEIAMDSETVLNYGGFPLGWITYNISMEGEQVLINIDYQWFNKTSTRLAESFMLEFTPVAKFGFSWGMDKLGSNISPLDVIQGGNQNQHAVWDGVSYGPNGNTSAFRVWSMDVPLVSPITDEIPATPLVNSVNPLSGNMLGFGFNLYNNIWNTNYILWYPLLTVEGKDEKLRFQVVIG